MESVGFRINTSKYLISIELQQFDSKIELPNGLYFKGLRLFDDGLDFDEKAGDGIYTSKEYLKVEENLPESRKLNSWIDLHNSSNPKFWCAGCNDVDLSGPGE